MRPQDVWNAIAEGQRLREQDPDFLNARMYANPAGGGFLGPYAPGKEPKAPQAPAKKAAPPAAKKPTIPSPAKVAPKSDEVVGPPAPEKPAAPAAPAGVEMPLPARTLGVRGEDTRAKQSGQSTNTYNKQEVLGPDEYRQALKYLDGGDTFRTDRELGPPRAMEAQKNSIDDMDASVLDYMKMPAQTDFSPLMALVDTWTGSKLAGAYNAPESGSERLLNVAKLKDAIAKQRGQFTDSQINLLKTLTGGYTQFKDVRGTEMATSQTNDDPNLVRTAGRGGGGSGNNPLLKEMRANLDKITQSAAARNEQFAQIDDAFKSGQYQRIMGILGQYARGVSGEKGVLTEPDIQRLIPSNWQTTVAKLDSYFRITPSSKVDPMYVAQLRKSIAEAKRNAASVYNGLIKTKEAMYKADPRYDQHAQRTVDAIRGGVSKFSGGEKTGPKKGDRRQYKGQTIEFQGGENKQENWKPVK
jgi:hypothetical protein